MNEYGWVALGGAAGSAARLACSKWLASPYSTLMVNLLGSFILGILAGLLAREKISLTVWQLAGVGFCGGFTTFSTFSVELVRLAYQNNWVMLFSYLIVSILGGVIAAVIGYTYFR